MYRSLGLVALAGHDLPCMYPSSARKQQSSIYDQPKHTVYDDLSADQCPADRLNPYAVDAYDGINLNPLEVVFVKVKSFLLQADWKAPKMSQTYDRWLSHQVFLSIFCFLGLLLLSQQTVCAEVPSVTPEPMPKCTIRERADHRPQALSLPCKQILTLMIASLPVLMLCMNAMLLTIALLRMWFLYRKLSYALLHSSYNRCQLQFFPAVSMPPPPPLPFPFGGYICCAQPVMGVVQYMQHVHPTSPAIHHSIHTSANPRRAAWQLAAIDASCAQPLGSDERPSIQSCTLHTECSAYCSQPDVTC